MKPIVVGSGMGGLAAAVILKKNGFNPVIFERKNNWGGSFTSYQIGNYVVDTGLHFLTRGSTGELPTLLRKYVGKDVFEKNFVRHKEYRFYLGEKEGKLPGNLSEMLKFQLLPAGERVRFVRMMLHFLRIGREGSDCDRPTYEYVKKFIKKDETLYFLNALSWMCNGCSIKKGSLSRFVDTFVRKRRLTPGYVISHVSSKRNGIEEDWYPKGGLVTVPKLLISEGLDVRTGREVESIVVKDNKVRGVRVGGKLYKSLIVIYDGLLRDLPGMIEGGSLEMSMPKYDDYDAITMWVGFKKKVADWEGASRIRIMESMESPHWCCFITDFEPKLAPSGHQLLGVSAIMHKEKRLMIKDMEKTIENFIPGYKKHMDMEHVQVCRAEKTLQKCGNSIFQLPEQKTNINGLYVVGTDTRGWGSGGTLCADSAMRCWNFIKNDINYNVSK